MKKKIVFLLVLSMFMMGCFFGLLGERYFVNDYRGNIHTFYNADEAIKSAISLGAVELNRELTITTFKFSIMGLGCHDIIGRDVNNIRDVVFKAAANIYKIRGKEAQELINRIQSAVHNYVKNNRACIARLQLNYSQGE